MSKLKPIGSEKLTGQAKIDRILEIASYKESTPQSINETEKIDYSINMVDGNQYFIVKERLGYVIKRGLNESTADYIEPMKNRKYYSSYSQGLKKLNLIARELNELYDNSEGVSLFGEQKRFTLKTPKPEPQSEPMAMPAAPATPPPVPATELPPAPTEMGGDMSVGDDAIPDDEMGGLDLGGADKPVDLQNADQDDEVTFRTIQKLTGKLSQKIRVLNSEDGMTSDEIKYVLNMVISALDLDQLDDDDREDILARLGETENDFTDVGEPEMGDTEIDMGIDDTIETPKIEAGESYDYKNRFSESKIDKLISSYFQLSESEERIEKKKAKNVEKQIEEINKLTESVPQKNIAKFFVKNNTEYSLIGLTNLKNLVFESEKGIVKITPKGKIINE